ncbi:hypothetical protein ACHAXT_007109 [Thalassiosira profunda]
MPASLEVGIEDSDDERAALSSDAAEGTPLDERILSIVRRVPKNAEGRRTIRPALLASELGLSVEDATKELCGLLSAVGGGEDGASFVFERVEMPGVDGGKAAAATTTTMVFSFPEDFAARAKRFRRSAEWKQRLHALTVGVVKAVKVFTAFGLIISLAVLIIAGICLLVAAVIALARGGHGGGGHRNHPLMHRLRYLFFQLRQILWLYAICGSAVDGNQDPFMREVAGDLAFMLSLCCGNPMHPFFWFRVGGMRRRWARVRRTRGWGGYDGEMDGITMMREGAWGGDNDQSAQPSRRGSSFNSAEQQRGLLSIAVEFLFGPSDAPSGSSGMPPPKELEKWKFRAYIVMTLSTTSEGNGVSLRDLLPYVDNPPASAEDPSAIRETLRIVTYFNGRPVDSDEASSGLDARFCFPEIVSEMDCQRLVTLGGSKFAPPAFSGSRPLSTILYRDEGADFGSSENASGGIPDYLYEQPLVLTELSREHFGQCALLGLLNFVGVIWIRNAMAPGGLLELSAARSRNGSLMALASILVLKLMNVLRFYAVLFFMLPFCRLVIVLVRNWLVERRNKRRLSFVRSEM